MPVIPFGDHVPVLGKDVFLAPDAWVTGKVQLGDQVSLFFGAVMRGDIQRIIVGARSNFQEHCLVHTSRGLNDCIIGEDVTVGHGAILHGCTVQDRCIIGMNSTILDDAVIESDCIIGANSLVTMRTRIPSGSLALGSPAKVVRHLTDKELKEIKDSAASYLKVANTYRDYFKRSPAPV
ncbi:MAG: gamma carbonic anhydrase family protein [Deltaproteobacteria bacterium]|nr:gamma carbonic anhydrase family protein [Deltaproteobacteria bacterium]